MFKAIHDQVFSAALLNWRKNSNSLISCIVKWFYEMELQAIYLSLCQEFKKTALTSNEAPSERLSSRCVLLQTIAHMSLFESFLKTWSGLIFFQLNGMEWYKEFFWSKMKNKPVLVLVFGWWKLQFWKPHSNAKSAFCTNWCTNL